MKNLSYDLLDRRNFARNLLQREYSKVTFAERTRRTGIQCFEIFVRRPAVRYKERTKMHLLPISPGKAFKRLATVGVTITAAAALLLPLSSATADEPSAQDGCTVGTSTIAECFPDQHLAAVVATAAGGGATTASPFTQHMVDTITTISHYNAGVTSLEGINLLTHLTDLELADSKIHDLSPIRTMTQLQKIDFSGYDPGTNQFTDISALTNLTNLTYIDLSPISPSYTRTSETNAIMDLSPLRGHTQLENLYLQNNSIRDISPLHGIIDKPGHPIYLHLDGNVTVLPKSRSSTSTSIETAKDLNGEYITPLVFYPTDKGHYDPSTGRVTWTGLAPESTVSLYYKSADIACACTQPKNLEGRIEQTLPRVDAPTPPVTTPPVTTPPSTNPPVTTPPSTTPPSTTPPSTTPPVTTPPSTIPPVTTPPSTNPPTTTPSENPPSTNPPATPPSCNPPSANPPNSSTTTPTSTLPECNPPSTQSDKAPGTPTATPNATTATTDSPKQAADQQPQAQASAPTQLATTGSNVEGIALAVIALILLACAAIGLKSLKRHQAER
ncbi:hypothetical protein [Bifidobacterium sp. ESL0745]|uniref:leucine-rich repeat domain-containing protein n=1 Tax=Bifidobacterium sp. ESL0745 TaxID=2983226 RepID=UPI0023F8069F|nr:hypothetical protein [Bifidobacterium sp. ESL0745]MDF7664507.1 hypothetical protein [Bifidobacterium sp. ESL0745]